VRLLEVDPAKITVAHNGVEPEFHPVRDDARKADLRIRLSLPERFILHVGTLEPRKNTRRLVEAYGQAFKSGTIGETALVLAGRKGWLYEPILEEAERVNREGGQVVFLDFVHDQDLVLLYNVAEAFAYPSVYEGFGLPAAEALACGTPTLVSRDGALREVVRDAAVIVDAESVDDIAQGLTQVVCDTELRERLRRAGPRQVARFTWDEAAKTVLQVYRGARGG
jgi:glycosyltransferase involved in cell wall biosynthesis